MFVGVFSLRLVAERLVAERLSAVVVSLPLAPRGRVPTDGAGPGIRCLKADARPVDRDAHSGVLLRVPVHTGRFAQTERPP